MKHKTSDNTNHPADELKNEISVYKINSIHGLLTRPARSCAKIFCGLVAPCGRGFGFTQLKRSAGTHFPTAHLPFSSSFLMREVHCGKSAQSPAVMQKVRETAQHPPHPSSEEEAASLSRFAILYASSSEDSRCCPDHRLFYTPAPHVAQSRLTLFLLRTLPRKDSSALAHMDFARAKPRHHCRTPYANQFVQRPPCSSVAPRHKLPSF